MRSKPIARVALRSTMSQRLPSRAPPRSGEEGRGEVALRVQGADACITRNNFLSSPREFHRQCPAASPCPNGGGKGIVARFKGGTFCWIQIPPSASGWNLHSRFLLPGCKIID